MTKFCGIVSCPHDGCGDYPVKCKECTCSVYTPVTSNNIVCMTEEELYETSD